MERRQVGYCNMNVINDFTADPVKALRLAILV